MAENSCWTMAMFPAIASLGLGQEHLAVLARQGSLQAEYSRVGKLYHKLRFRVGAKQQVRYVGNNPAFVAQVRGELTRLQAKEKSRRHLQRLIEEADRVSSSAMLR